jgi:hypothetical protein
MACSWKYQAERAISVGGVVVGRRARPIQVGQNFASLLLASVSADISYAAPAVHHLARARFG